MDVSDYCFICLYLLFGGISSLFIYIYIYIYIYAHSTSEAVVFYM